MAASAGDGAIAVVGLGSILPGATDLDGFWEMVRSGRSAARPVPEGRWRLPVADLLDREGRGVPDRCYSDRACFVEGFTPDFTGLDERAVALAAVDPLYAFVLHAGAQAWRSARTERVDPSRVSVVLGNIALPTDASSALTESLLGSLLAEAAPGWLGEIAATADPRASSVAALPGGLLARALGLGGGCMTLDAACASSLYAIRLAMDDLRAGRIDAALAGGLSRPACLYTQMGFSQLRALSARGVCSPFDADADGIVVGEGAGIVLLKRLEDALRDGDHVHGVLRAAGLSNDLHGSLLSPSSEGQVRAMEQAYREARWDPTSVDLLECHATGTPVGDAVEARSVAEVRSRGGRPTRPAVLGSVKSNTGHLLTGAGGAGLLKVLLALRHGVLPPTAHFRAPSKESGLSGGPLRVLASAEPWDAPAPGVPRRAAVSAFGFGGINAHLLVEEFLPGAGDGARVFFPGAVGEEGATRPPAEDDEPVAVVGMAARFAGPGDAFRTGALRGDATPPRPAPRRWGAAESAAARRRFGSALAAEGRFLDSIEVPAGAFRIPPRELEEMLPQQVLMLDVAAGALREAGLDASTEKPRAGVFIGMELDPNTTNFHLRWAMPDLVRQRLRAGDDPSEEERRTTALREAAGPPLTANRTMGALGGMVASRIAREFRMGGPSYSLHAEEASALRSVEAAVRALRRGDLDVALAGSVDLAGDVRSVLRRGDVTDGEPSGEGAAAFVLKRLSDARRDGDRVLAVVRGIGTASGAPGEGFASALERAYAAADVAPASVDLYEAHGGALAAEEAAACDRFFGREPRPHALVVAAASESVGRAGAASGAASLARAVAALAAETLPRSRGDGPLARAFGGIGGGRFVLPAGPRAWLRDRVAADGSTRPRRAGVTALGLDGGACHVVLEAGDGAPVEGVLDTARPLGDLDEALFAIDGDDTDALRSGIDALRALERAHPSDAIETLARRWWRTRPTDPARSYGAAVVAGSRVELRERLARADVAVRDGVRVTGTGGADGVFHSPEPLGGETALVFPGSGNQSPGLGRALFAALPGALRRLDARTGTLRSQMSPDLFWEDRPAEDLEEDHRALITGQVALKTASAELLLGLGVRPDAVVGYSLGETAGLFAMGAWTDRDLMLRRVADSTLFTRDLAGPCEAARRSWRLAPGETVDWVLGVVDRGPEVVRRALRKRRRAYLLIVNTSAECVLGGDRREVEAVVHTLQCAFHPVRGVTTVHCDVAREVEDRYHDLHLFPTTPPAGVRFYSGVLGSSYEVYRESAAASITGQALETLDFRRVVEAAWADGVRIFLETGPGASCTRMIGRILGDSPHAARSALVAGRGETGALLRALAMLVAERSPVDPGALYGGAIAEETQRAKHAGDVVLRPGGDAFTVAGAGGGSAADFVAELATDFATDFASNAPVRPVHDAGEPLPAAGRSDLAVDGARRFAATATRADAAIPSRPAPPPRPLAPLAVAPAPTQRFEVAPVELPSDLRPLLAVATATSEAHAAYLRFSEGLAETLAMGAALAARSPAETWLPASAAVVDAHAVVRSVPRNAPVGDDSAPLFLDRAGCLEFARGSAGRALGPEFAEIDAHPTRVRLPDEPLMLADRILSVEGTPRSLGSGRVVTEHDVLPGAWYLDGGRIPTCIAVEAGQADLFLSGWLGIDFVTKGRAVYRLLDAVVTFHGPLPRAGSVIRYDIRIDHFFRQGETHLFRFRFDATVDGVLVLTMREGCAGFFTAEELAAGRGIVRPALRDRVRAEPAERPWLPVEPAGPESLDASRLEALRRGDLVAAFGDAFEGQALRRAAGLPGGAMTLVHRIPLLDARGGAAGLGFVRGEMDIRPDDWFLTCHFVDDRVMPGTLMYECCLHTLRVLLMRMGWVGEDGVCEPLPGTAGRLRCRGQVTESTKVVTYEVTVKSMGYGPDAWCIADALMLADGKPIVEMLDMSLRFPGMTEASLRRLWEAAGRDEEAGAGAGEESDAEARAESGEAPPSRLLRSSPPGRGGASGALSAAAPGHRPALYDTDRILAFAVGKPSDAFGDRYLPFDDERRIARLPGPPFQFLDRVVALDHEPWKLAAGGTVETEYDIPADAWYFDTDRSPTMPFAVLLEAALQPCGWFAAYMGSALTSDVDLRFRNLGGEAVRLRDVTPGSGTLAVRIRCTSVSSSGGMILQHFSMRVTDAVGVVYEGTTYFGFFSAETLSNQIGIRDAKPWRPADGALATAHTFTVPATPPFPGAMLRMVDFIEAWLPDGGPAGLGWARGSIGVDPEAWFFKAHFFQDPVWPGSLGLESFLQVMQVIAAERWGLSPGDRFETVPGATPHRWIYRGQVLPTDAKVTVEAAVTAADDPTKTLTAAGYLSVDGRIIYEMHDFKVRVRRD